VWGLCGYAGGVVATGHFTTAGGAPASHVALWRDGQWSPLGAGLSSVGNAAIVFNGDLIVGGIFSAAGGVTCRNIARWDGAAWHNLGNGLNSDVYSLGVYRGQLYAGGAFTQSGSVVTGHLARWNGQSWERPDASLGSALSMIEWNDSLAVAGQFNGVGSVISTSVALYGCPCYANCDNSTTQPVLNTADFSCFLNAFTSGNPYANCDMSATPPALNIADFLCFLNRFASGCP